MKTWFEFGVGGVWIVETRDRAEADRWGKDFREAFLDMDCQYPGSTLDGKIRFAPPRATAMEPASHDGAR